MSRSNWTGRTARSLSEAFGPHTAERIDEGPHWSDEPLSLLIASVVTVLTCWAVVVALFTFWSAP